MRRRKDYANKAITKLATNVENISPTYDGALTVNHVELRILGSRSHRHQFRLGCHEAIRH